MGLRTFLETVVTTDNGQFVIGLRPSATRGRWYDRWFEWPGEIEQAIALAEEAKHDFDVYFSSHLFKERHSTKDNVLPTRTIQADLDEADLTALPVRPTIIIETSPGRHQAYWILETTLDLEDHERLSRRLTYSIRGCDPSGWPLGRKPRLPLTYNHKYVESPSIRIAEWGGKLCKPDVLGLLPDPSLPIEGPDVDWIEHAEHIHLDIGPRELLKRCEKTLSETTFASYDAVTDNRSESLYALGMGAFKAGLSREEVYWLCKHSANNKFAHLRYNGERELAKDVVRYEQDIRAERQDVRKQIKQARTTPNKTLRERREMIANLVINHLRDTGVFIRTDDDTSWYVRTNPGRPVSLSERSEWLRTLLDVETGLNATDKDHEYAVASLVAMTRSQKNNGMTAILSHYDRKHHALILHSGRNDVWFISDQTINHTYNGASNIVFPWPASVQPFSIDLDNPIDNWHEFVFGPCLQNVLDLSIREAIVLMRAWFHFVLFRELAYSRPILSVFGQPGCLSGKTMLQIRRNKQGAVPMTLESLYHTRQGRWWIRSLKDGVIQYRAIRNVVASGTKMTYRVVIGGHDPIYATRDHRFLTPDGYRELHTLRPGSVILVQSGMFGTATAIIQSIEPWGEEPTYDIEMEDADAPNFVVNGVVVHNSGKSTMFKRLYALLYGRKRSLNAVTRFEDYDQALARNALVVLDNVDTWERWLPDRLALAAGTSDIERRKLYTDSDSHVYKRQAIVGLTAHSPRFGREDVADRLVIMTLERLKTFRPEGELIEQIMQERDRLWGGIVRDIQRILSTPMPSADQIPQFRIEDFARLGYWFSTAIGEQETFSQSLTKITTNQRRFSLDEDVMLINDIRVAIERDKSIQNRFVSAVDLWEEIMMVSHDPISFRRKYHNSTYLGRKLWSLQESLRQVFNVETSVDTKRGVRLWKLQPME